MIALPAIYKAFGLNTTPPPHNFQIDRVGEILLPIESDQESGQAEKPIAKRIHIIPANAALPMSRIETIIRAGERAAAQSGLDLFASHDRAQNIRFHIISPGALDESAAVLKLLETLAQYLSEQDRGPEHV